MQLFAIAIAAAAATSPFAQAAAVPSSSSSSAFTWRQAGCVVASSSRSSSHASSSSAKPGWTEHCLDRCGALSPNRYAMVSISGSHSRCACPDEMPEGAMTLTSVTCSPDEAVVYVREPTVAPAASTAGVKSSSWSFSLTGAASKLFNAILPSSAPLPAEPTYADADRNGEPVSPIVSVLDSRAEALSSDIHDILTTIASHELALRGASSEEEQLHDLRMVYILEEQLEEVMKERRRVKRAARRLARIDLLGMSDDVVRAVEDMYVGPLLDSWRADERGALEVDSDMPAYDDESEEEEAWVFQPLPGRYGRKRPAY